MEFKVLRLSGMAFMVFLLWLFIFGLQAQGVAAAEGLQPERQTGAKSDTAAKTVPKKPVNITSDRMESDKKENIVTFSGNVAAEEDFILCSDELRVSYDENKEIKEILATGNVRILKEGKTAASDGALYDRKARTIILTGKAVVTQCSDSIRGEKIVYSIDTDRATAEGGHGGRVKAAIMSQKKCKEGVAPLADEKAKAAMPPSTAPESAEAWCKKNSALPR